MRLCQLTYMSGVLYNTLVENQYTSLVKLYVWECKVIVISLSISLSNVLDTN